VPADKAVRERLRSDARDYARQVKLLPPVPLSVLLTGADEIIARSGVSPTLRELLCVLLSNAIWEQTLAGVPFERRVLLLPQCLRDKRVCPAKLDEFGLLCELCGSCATGELQSMAEELGYVVLVAEGTTVVTKLLESGQVDAVIGVSCLSALQRSFPFTAAAAVPALAIPLVRDGCSSTELDLDWVHEALMLRSERRWRPQLDLEQLRQEVRSWFAEPELVTLLASSGTWTEKLACEWMAAGGKRWRPVLASAVYRTLAEEEAHQQERLKTLAIAVECFHKASLIHDDIEDQDACRYGVETLHIQHGVPIALNVGDLLIGEGYRLLAALPGPAELRARMLEVAAAGHCQLCLGQGEELAWARSPRLLGLEQVLETYRHKTAPAFTVALSLGAVAAGADRELVAILAAFSDALGAAYQIRDDIEDHGRENVDNDLMALRPSLLLALAAEHADEPTRALLEDAFAENRWSMVEVELLHRLIEQHHLVARAWQLFAETKQQALHALDPLRQQALKALLFRLCHKVLGDPPDKLDLEPPVRHAESGEPMVSLAVSSRAGGS